MVTTKKNYSTFYEIIDINIVKTITNINQKWNQQQTLFLKIILNELFKQNEKKNIYKKKFK